MQPFVRCSSSIFTDSLCDSFATFRLLYNDYLITLSSNLIRWTRITLEICTYSLDLCREYCSFVGEIKQLNGSI